MADTPSKQHGHGVESEGGLSVSSAGQPNLRHPPLPHSGHKASFRSANKLARRARSFKEDFLERISAMSLRGQGPGHDHRSHSPLSPKARSAQKSDDPESNPARDLELLVRQVRFDLKHFCDVISKKKLEMLPGNGTIVLDTITNIHTAIRPYVSPLGASPSAALASALARLCQALAQLIRLCDEGMLGGEGCAALQSSNVENVTQEVQKSVEELAAIAFEKMAGRAANKAKANGTAAVEPKNLKLQVRPGVDGVRNSVNDNQRNSLPDIPLTPRERHILEMSGSGLPVRTSHSTESILDSLATSPHPEPPPKPPRPVRTMDIAPPLPPKKKSTDNSSLLGLSTIDRVSLQSHSSGSLDSILNISNDEEIRAIMDRSSTNLEDSVQHTTADILGLCGCPDGYSQTNGNRSSLESNSTIGTVSSVGAPGNRLSNEMVPGNQQHGANNRLSSEMTSNHCDTNHNRFSNESGFVSMGNNRSSEISYSSFNSSSTTHQHHQKTSLAFIDSTPTPGDIPSSIITDFCEEKPPKIPSPIGKTLTVNSMANVVQQSMKQMTTSSNLFEQNSSKMIGFNGKITQAFNHTSKTSNSAFKSTEISNNAFEFGKSLKVESVSQSFQSKTQNVSTTTEGSLDGFAANNGGFSDAVDAASSLPPALPIKTRRCLKGITSATCDNLNESGISLMSSSFDDTIEFRDHSCSLQGPDGLMQRPHTLMDASGQPPPLPLKKKHIMAYMEMFGNCSHSPQSSTEFMRHSVHAYNQAGGVVTQTQLQQMALNSQLLNYTQHMQQFTVSNSQQNLSGFSSPLRSPRLAREDSIKSDASSVNSISTSGSVPPALPPKRTKIQPASQQSPAKPISPAPLLLPPGAGSVTPSPCSASPLPVSSTSPAPTLAPPISPLPQQVSPSPGSVTSPPPRFQFHPPPAQQNIEDTLLLNVEDDSWQQRSPNKPGKFPVDDLDLEQRTNASSSPGSQNAEPSIDTETEDIILDMDVSSRLVYKRSNEEGPEIRGGHPDALVVHAIKCTKDFSYQEAFLTTYRTFVTPKELIEKLNRRHAFLARHGKHTKAREVQGLLTRIVGDLTLADLDSDLLQLIMDFVYGLVNSGDLAMAKVLRVIILDKHKSKQIMVQQQQQQAFSGVCQVVMSARRDSVLEQKAEAVAEQMTLLDAELFTRIPAPEALLWARDQCEERSPNLTRFTEHFNKMSFWARSRILEQEEQREREKYVTKFIKVMKHLRKMNNFNSYLALLSALDSAPVRRLEWQKHITDGLKEYCALIDSSSSFRAYRQALAETNPPCIPYIGLVLQDLTFVHIGNTDLLPDGSINFSKRWQQYHILENMKRFSKAQYTFKKNERIISMFNGFDDVLNEEAMWQISESIKPRKKTAVT